MKPLKSPLRRPGETQTTAALLFAGLSYLLAKSLLSGDPTIDYQFIWLAGDLWGDGLDPYSPAYGARGEELFHDTYSPKAWFYPPSWWPVAMPAGSTSFETGVLIWRGLSAACLVVGVLIVVRAYRHSIGPVSRLRAAGFLAFTCLMSATPIVLSIGQTSLLSFLGAALFIAAYLGDRRYLMIPALYLLMLKPQIGLPFCVFLLATRYWWPSLIAAAVVSLLASAPALTLSGIGGFLDAYLGQFAFHEDMAPNHPDAMTGARHLLFGLFGWQAPALPLTLAAAIPAFLLGLPGTSSPEARAMGLAGLLIAVCLFVPLHTYDMMLAAPLIILAGQMAPAVQAIGTVGLLLIFRANNLADLTGIHPTGADLFIGSRITTLGVLLLACAAAWALGRRAAARMVSPDTGQNNE